MDRGGAVKKGPQVAPISKPFKNNHAGRRACRILRRKSWVLLGRTCGYRTERLIDLNYWKITRDTDLRGMLGSSVCRRNLALWLSVMA
jgi:hypothetical protein